MKWLNHNSGIFTFSIPPMVYLIKPPISCYFKARFPALNPSFAHSYTPIHMKDYSAGMINFLVKRYQMGLMSNAFFTLKAGEFIELKGPFQKYPIETTSKKTIGMIAGGTGITPMLQIIEHVLESPEHDRPLLFLLYANVSEEDILLKETIDGLAKNNSDILKVKYVIDKSNDNAKWDGYRGHISVKMIAESLPEPSDETVILVSGPPLMLDLVCGRKKDAKDQGDLHGLLKERGFSRHNVYKM